MTRRIAHISDLHFGRIDPEIVEGLARSLTAAAPDLVVVSGDLTQRARVGQFAQARAFIDRLPAPALTVPGNHDTPLDNLLLRFFAPWRRYRAAISTDLQPVYTAPEVVILGVNSVNRFAVQQGRLPSQAIRRAEAAFAEAGKATRIVVIHHPLELPPAETKPVMGQAAVALDGFSQAGADIVLSGHLHSTHIAPFTRRPGLLFVQAGTLSTRTRGEQNSFNILDLSHRSVTVTARRVDAEGHFATVAQLHYRKGDDRWEQGEAVVSRTGFEPVTR